MLLLYLSILLPRDKKNQIALSQLERPPRRVLSGFCSSRASMVVVEEVTRLSERRTQTSSEAFPDEGLASIRSAVVAVPADVFDGSTKHSEVGGFDAGIADGLPQYEYEGNAAGGYNPNCNSGRIWGSITASTSTTQTPASPSRSRRASGRTSATTYSNSRRGTGRRRTVGRRSSSAVSSSQ